MSNTETDTSDAETDDDKVHITDPFGNEKPYTPEKILDSVQRSGFNEHNAKVIEEQVRERVEDGMHSQQLYQIVYEEMKELNQAYALRYRLREAIGALNPQHHEFEKYVAKVLALDGVETEWSPRPLPQGACSTHEIDVVGEDDGTTYAVECKHHYHYHRLTGMDVPMIQFAAMEDLQQGHEQGVKHAVDVDRSWVIVNTKLSAHAKEYAECKGIRMTAWDYPDGGSLREIVEQHKAYPITILRLPEEQRIAYSKNDILTVQDLLELTKDEKADLTLPNEAIADAQHKAQRLLELE